MRLVIDLWPLTSDLCGTDGTCRTSLVLCYCWRMKTWRNTEELEMWLKVRNDCQAERLSASRELKVYVTGQIINIPVINQQVITSTLFIFLCRVKLLVRKRKVMWADDKWQRGDGVEVTTPAESPAGVPPLPLPLPPHSCSVTAALQVPLEPSPDSPVCIHTFPLRSQIELAPSSRAWPDQHRPGWGRWETRGKVPNQQTARAAAQTGNENLLFEVIEQAEMKWLTGETHSSLVERAHTFESVRSFLYLQFMIWTVAGT